MIALHTTKLVEIFVNLDDFVKKLSTAPEYTSERIFMEETQMSKSELMTIVVFYHHAGFGTEANYLDNKSLEICYIKRERKELLAQSSV